MSRKEAVFTLLSIELTISLSVIGLINAIQSKIMGVTVGIVFISIIAAYGVYLIVALLIMIIKLVIKNRREKL